MGVNGGVNKGGGRDTVKIRAVIDHWRRNWKMSVKLPVFLPSFLKSLSASLCFKGQGCTGGKAN